MPRPDTDLARANAAYAALAATMDTITDGDVREPSLLPGWTRGHVLSHIARNADGNAAMVEGALRGEIAQQYPGGTEQRSRDIEAGADRPAAELVADVERSHAALVDAWSRVPADAWERGGDSFATGVRPISAGTYSRTRELYVHHVDLGLAFGASDLPADWVAADLEWLRQFRTAEVWDATPWTAGS